MLHFKQERRLILELVLLFVTVTCMFLNTTNQTINCSSPAVREQVYTKPADQSNSLPPSCQLSQTNINRCMSKLTPLKHQAASMVSLTNRTENEVSCTFLDELLESVECNIELETIKVVMNHVTANDTVLEFGGRYGTTTCALAVAQGNTGRLVSVEPDPRVWWVHEVNKVTHNCAATSVYGVVGSQPQSVVSVGYNTFTVTTQYGVEVGYYTWDQVERSTGLTFDTVVFDCEGCFNYVVRENIEKFVNVKKIILEYDVPNIAGGVLLTLQSWEEAKQTLDVLKQLGFSILPGPESQDCLNNLRRDETGDYSIMHRVGCHFVLLR